MQPLWVATRKGLFSLKASDNWRVGTPSFLGDPVSMVLDDARDGAVYAALNLGHFGSKLHCSTDRGATWQERSVPSYAGMPARSPAPRSARGHTTANRAGVEADLGARRRRRRSARTSLGRHASRRLVPIGRRRTELGARAIAVGPAGAQELVRWRRRFPRHSHRVGRFTQREPRARWRVVRRRLGERGRWANVAMPRTGHVR